MKVACLIVGIDGWEEYTLPLIEQIRANEPECAIVVVDNASETPYHYHTTDMVKVVRTPRLCYAAAINRAKREADKPVWGVNCNVDGDKPDWYVILSNDVSNEFHFVDRLARISKNCVAGPEVRAGFTHTQCRPLWHIQGWCVCISRESWDILGDWDENFQMSSWEDVDYSLRAFNAGLTLLGTRQFPFQHLNAGQRYELPNFKATDHHNIIYLEHKHGLR